MIERVIDPYRRHWRTLHKEYANPDKRLQEYKRKTINIATFAEPKEEQKPPRVLYPVPPKYEEPKADEDDDKIPEGEPGADGVPPAPTDGEVPPEGQPPPEDGAPPA